MKNKIKAFFTAAVMCVSALGSTALPINELETEAAASFSYPVQQFMMGIGDTNRNVNTSDTEADSPITSQKLNGTEGEKWYLNYISAGVYEIVNAETGYLLTNDGSYCTIAADADAANQRWNITPVQKDFEGYDLYYKITSNADSDLALTFTPDTNSFSAETYSGNIYQKYKLNLDGLEGYAANAKVSGGEKAGTIGGLLGETVFVDTTEECIEAMKREEPLTIVITANIGFYNWDKTDQKIEDNKTIIGSYKANIIYDSQWRNDDFYGDENDPPSCNIVLQNLHFRATELNSNGCGVILVYIYGGRNIWFDHNDFSASFGHDRDNEVGKFIWINTPSIGWADDCYNEISPDYITISYNHFNNRYWTVAYGTQNTETSRDRTTLMFNKWENCARRTPQIGNGTGHVYNSYHTYSVSEPSQQIIAGDGCKMLTEYCYFEGLTGLEFAGGGSSSSPFRDAGSVSAENTGSSASAMNKSFSYSHNWNPGTENYGYHLITANNTKSFCNSYSGAVTKLSDMKFITDSDLSGWIMKTYVSPFLKDITVGELAVGKKGAVMNTDVTYVFENANSGLYLEVAEGTAASGTNVQQGITGAFGWKLADAGDGYYYMFSEVGDGKTYCLDLPYGSTDNGTSMGIWTNDESDARKFKFVDNGDGTYAIVTKCTKDASGIGVVAASTEEAADVIQWKCNDSADQKWIAKVRVNGGLIDEILVADYAGGAGWTIDSSLAVGDQVFCDRVDDKLVTYASVPSELEGAEFVITACDAKNVETDLATLRAGADITLYVGLDSRVATIPSWLSNWTKTALTAVNSKDVIFNLYKLELNAGDTVTLGSNGQSSGCVNYTVFAVQNTVEITTTTTEESTTETTSAEQTETTTVSPAEPEKLGDATCDGEVDINDAVLIMSHMANKTKYPLSATAVANGDVYQQGDGISIGDANSIQKYLARIIKSFPES